MALSSSCGENSCNAELQCYRALPRLPACVPALPCRYQAALFGISVAVGLTPELLPLVVNGNLARGAVALARQRASVKRLDAVQNLGATDVVCSDKTGTLTLDEVRLVLP